MYMSVLKIARTRNANGETAVAFEAAGSESSVLFVMDPQGVGAVPSMIGVLPPPN